MILIAFENDAFPLLRQYPSGINDWKEDEMHSLYILPDGSDKLLQSVKRRRKKTEREGVLKNILKSECNTFDELYDWLFKARRYLDSDLIYKHFN